MALTHGMTRIAGRNSPIDPTYLSWQRMKSRCLNPKAPDYAHYGGRGIKICERWLKFENFLADMGRRERNQQIDRFPDNDGHYEPNNCRWATKKQNARNRRRSVVVIVDGISRSAAEWDEVMGLPRDTVSSRLLRGWDTIKAVKTPIDPRFSHKSV